MCNSLVSLKGQCASVIQLWSIAQHQISLQWVGLKWSFARCLYITICPSAIKCGPVELTSTIDRIRLFWATILRHATRQALGRKRFVKSYRFVNWIFLKTNIMITLSTNLNLWAHLVPKGDIHNLCWTRSSRRIYSKFIKCFRFLGSFCKHLY